MHNKFNILTKDLELLKKKINQAPPVSQISSKDFLKYHSLISKKELLESEIYKLLNLKNSITNTYNSSNEKWLYDDNMNCKKYCKLEKKASYSRDKKLYKLGFLDSKPIHPFLQNLKQFISTKVSSPASIKLTSIKNKFQSFICKTPIHKVSDYVENTLPIKLTNIAISGTKRCIIGYRNITNSLNTSTKTFSRQVSSAPIIKFLSYINNQAKKEADLQSNSFLARIKVDIPNTPNLSLGNFYSNNNIQSNNIKSDSSQDSLDLAL